MQVKIPVLLGETFAELVAAGILVHQELALDIIDKALMPVPSEMERGRCFACLAAFYMRLSFFSEASSIPMHPSAKKRCRSLLPALLAEVWLAS